MRKIYFYIWRSLFVSLFITVNSHFYFYCELLTVAKCGSMHLIKSILKVLLPMNTTNSNEIIEWDKYFYLIWKSLFVITVNSHFYYELFSSLQCGSMHLIRSSTVTVIKSSCKCKRFLSWLLSAAAIHRCSYKKVV